MAFTDELTLRKMTDDELMQMDLLEISRMQRARMAVMEKLSDRKMVRPKTLPELSKQAKKVLRDK